MAVVIRSSRAELDLIEISEHIANDNVAAAIRFIDAVEAAVTLLAEHPLSGREYPLKLRQKMVSACLGSQGI